MAFKMKNGSPFHRNFGVGKSPMKGKETGDHKHEDHHKDVKPIKGGSVVSDRIKKVILEAQKGGPKMKSSALKHTGAEKLAMLEGSEYNPKTKKWKTREITDTDREMATKHQNLHDVNDPNNPAHIVHENPEYDEEVEGGGRPETKSPIETGYEEEIEKGVDEESAQAHADLSATDHDTDHSEIAATETPSELTSEGYPAATSEIVGRPASADDPSVAIEEAMNQADKLSKQEGGIESLIERYRRSTNNAFNNFGKDSTAYKTQAEILRQLTEKY